MLRIMGEKLYPKRLFLTRQYSLPHSELQSKQRSLEGVDGSKTEVTKIFYQLCLG